MTNAVQVFNNRNWVSISYVKLKKLNKKFEQCSKLVFRSGDCEVDKQVLHIKNQKYKKSIYLNSPPKKSRTTDLLKNLWTLYFTFQWVSYAVSQKYQFLEQILNIHRQKHCHDGGIKTPKKQRSCWCQQNRVQQYQCPGRVSLLHPKPTGKTGTMKIQILNLVILGREGKHFSLILFQTMFYLPSNCLERSWVWDLKKYREYISNTCMSYKLWISTHIELKMSLWPFV